jgi:hypothetical protein
MEKSLLFFTENAGAWLIVILSGLLVAYLVFKHLIKLALVIIIIVLAVAGYHYFQDPQKLPETMAGYTKETVEKTMALPEKVKQITAGIQNMIDRVTKLFDWEQWFPASPEEAPGETKDPGKPAQKL